jgi:septum formation topological specificity factor MinE
MTGKFKGFVFRLKQDFLNIISTHYFIHREALMIKSIPDELKNVLDLVIKMVNYI